MSQQTTTEVTADVRAYVVDRFLFGQGAETLSDDASFLESGIVDSTGVLEIVMFLEQRFGIKVKDEELVPDNLDSIRNITAFVGRKLQ
ncbi:MAG TPA: acyl carrier protein [Nitrospira sp.]|nr:acyl carrier protein [Nitrospira sp.]